MSRQLVSVVMPVFNGSAYLRQAVESVLAQSYKDREVIIVNDGSSDGGRTREVALSFGTAVRYFEKQNGGVSTALNRGLDEMRGDWFAWLSHDDLFDPRRLETDMNVLSDGKYRISFCRWQYIDERNRPLPGAPVLPPFVRSPREAMGLGGVDMCSVTIHRSCFDRVGRFNISNKTMQDVEMSLRLAAGYDFIHNPGSVTSRRRHPLSGTSLLRSINHRERKKLGLFIERELPPQVFSRDLVAGGHPLEARRAYADCLASFGQETQAIVHLASALVGALACMKPDLRGAFGILRAIRGLIRRRVLRALGGATT